jgi:hypothetical protein
MTPMPTSSMIVIKERLKTVKTATFNEYYARNDTKEKSKLSSVSLRASLFALSEAIF